MYIYTLFAKAIFDNLQSEHILLQLDIQIPVQIFGIGNSKRVRRWKENSSFAAL